MHGLFGWALLLQFHQILTYVMFHVRHFRELLSERESRMLTRGISFLDGQLLYHEGDLPFTAA